MKRAPGLVHVVVVCSDVGRTLGDSSAPIGGWISAVALTEPPDDTAADTKKPGTG